MRSLLRIATAAVAVSGAVVALQDSSRPSWNVSTLGIVRFGRAAVAVGAVMIDYKWTFYSMDPDSETYLQTRSQVHQRSAERLLAMCQRNGGCFIKVGQHIGSLDYLLPPEYVNTMKILHQQAPPQSTFEELQSVIQQDFGQDIKELFSSFDELPLASASLAQVHRAVRSNDGKAVAVKVQHPHVKAHATVDMATMKILFDAVARIFPEFEFGWLVEETKKNLPLELDFIHEAHNCEKATQMFSNLDFLKIPSVDWSVTSQRVLTMEFCDGGSITDYDYMRKNNISIDEALTKLGQLYSEMIFVRGYIHCDPHPGNLFVRKTEAGVQIVLLDHGLYQTLPDDLRVNYCRLWQSILRADVDDIKTHSAQLGIGQLYALFACIVSGRSWTAIQRGIDKQTRSSAEALEIQASAGAYIPEIISILNTVPRPLLLIFKTNDLLRGIETRLAEHSKRYSAMAFLTMSRCCVRAMCEHLTAQCGDSAICRWRHRVRKQWLLIQLSVYEMYLRVSNWLDTLSRPFRVTLSTS